MKTVTFKKLPNGKYSFEVAGDNNATAFLLKNTINHSVKEAGLAFARPALEALLKKYDPDVDYTITEESAMAKLNEFCTSLFRNGGGLQTEIISHSPDKIEAILMLPDWKVFRGMGTNQRLARQEAATMACTFYKI